MIGDSVATARVDVPVETLDLAALGSLEFEAVDMRTFACLRLAREAAAAGGTAPCVLNAANEVAVHAFLARFVAFPSPAAHVAATLWVAHCHMVEAFESSPRLALLSPEPGSGKTRVLEVCELLVPNAGTLRWDGVDLAGCDPALVRAQIAPVFQDFSRYQFLAGENVGAGDGERFEDEQQWRVAATKGMAAPIVEALPDGYYTQLGRWFAGGRELSGGQWQKVALSRAFVRSEADLIVLDEPTAAMDAAAEAEVFEHVRSLVRERMAILISHRFSTVRMADTIVVLHRGRIVEQGSHEALLRLGGRYAHLFSLQAAGYQ